MGHCKLVFNENKSHKPPDVCERHPGVDVTIEEQNLESLLTLHLTMAPPNNNISQRSEHTRQSPTRALSPPWLLSCLPLRLLALVGELVRCLAAPPTTAIRLDFCLRLCSTRTLGSNDLRRRAIP